MKALSLWWAILPQSWFFRYSEGYQEDNKISVYNPIRPSKNEDIIVVDPNEYIFIDTMASYSSGQAVCKQKYKGRLAIVNSVHLANTLALALAETKLDIQLAWIGGMCQGTSWYWMNDKIPTRISSTIKNLFVNYSQSVPTGDRKCLAMGRKLHLTPQFPIFNCRLHRPFLCERSCTTDFNSNHVGWFRFRNFLYKIFTEQLTWDQADNKCAMYDAHTYLAYVPDYKTAQVLARQMLIGRPTLEKAWIGARLVDHNFQFVKEKVILANQSVDNYPPWLNENVTTGLDCIILDHHLIDAVNFAKSHCDNNQGYICYKQFDDTGNKTKDIFIDEFGYRIFFKKLPWDGAKSKCKLYETPYQAKMVEIREKRIVNHLLYIMGENVTAIEHLWLGGIFNFDTQNWVWISDNTPIQIEDLLGWVKNTTYFQNWEFINICLNMDRENFIDPLHYGTDCEYPQHFVCTFSKDNLLRLQEDEKNGIIPID